MSSLSAGIGQLSLMDGWALGVAQLLAAAALIGTIEKRSRRWHAVWLPATVAVAC